MCGAAREITVRAVQLSIVLAFCAVLLLIDAGRMTAENYGTYLLVDELYRLPQALLITASVAGVVAEDLNDRRQ